MSTLQGQVVWITGSSSGIGYQAALRFAAEGAIPVLTARSVDKLEALAEEIRSKHGIEAPVYRLDVQSEAEVQAVAAQILERFGRVDILLNGSGFGVFGTTAELPTSDFEAMMDVNYFGLVRCTKAVLPSMLARRKGHIINIASIASFIAAPKQGGYAATKFAVMGFSEALQYELLGTGVHLSNVNPGPVETPFFDKADRSTMPAGLPFLTADQVTDVILRAVAEKKPLYIVPKWFGASIQLRYLFPRFYRSMMTRMQNKKAPR